MKKGLILEERIVMMKMEEDYKELSASLENNENEFVKAELIPPRGEWWTHPDHWEFKIDEESMLPNWFLGNMKDYEQKFRKKVRTWWNEHCVVNNHQFQCYDHGYYLLKDCKNVKLSGDVIVKCNSCKIVEVSNYASIKELVSSSVEDVFGNAEIWDMFHSTVLRMRDESEIENCTDSLIEEMKNEAHVLELQNSHIYEMYDTSKVYKMKGSSTIRMITQRASVETVMDASIINDSMDMPTLEQHQVMLSFIGCIVIRL